jgi:hypothetical protein
MRNRLCFLPAPGRCDNKSRRRLVRATLTAALLCAAADAALAVTVPAWVQAQTTAVMPEHDADADAVTLYSEVALTVQSGGKIQRHVRGVYRILRREGVRRGLVRVDFDAQSRITSMQGWCIPSDGKPYAVSDRDAVESALVGVLHGELMSDVRSKVLRIPAAVPGSIIAYEFEQELHPYLLADQWTFQDTALVHEARYSLELPPGWQYAATWVNHEEESPLTLGPNRWQWIVKDVQAIKPELQMPPPAAIASRLVVSMLPPSGHEAGFRTWSELGTWYLQLTKGRRATTSDIKQKVLELTASQPTVLGKMQSLAQFVQNDIRYVAIELGVGSLQPHSADEVLTHRYGDCKDKATLLSAMLKEIGVDSHYLIVNTQRGAITDSTPANLGFDHVILAIQLPNDVNDPSLLAVVANAKLGRMLIFDPTNTYTPLGRLSGPLQAGYGLLVAPDGGQLIRLPEQPSTSSGVQRTAHLELDQMGLLRGEVHEIRIGDSAAIERSAVAATTQEADRVKSVESVLSQSFASFQLTKAAVGNLHESSRPLEWIYTFEVEHYAKMSGNLLTVRPRVLGSESSGLLETRDPRLYDIEFVGPRQDTDTFEIDLPSGYQIEELPPPIDEAHDFAEYHSKTELVGRTLRYTRTFEVKDVSVPVAQAEELRQFYRIINNDERMPAVLVRTNP